MSPECQCFCDYLDQTISFQKAFSKITVYFPKVPLQSQQHIAKDKTAYCIITSYYIKVLVLFFFFFNKIGLSRRRNEDDESACYNSMFNLK